MTIGIVFQCHSLYCHPQNPAGTPGLPNDLAPYDFDIPRLLQALDHAVHAAEGIAELLGELQAGEGVCLIEVHDGLQLINVVDADAAFFGDLLEGQLETAHRLIFHHFVQGRDALQPLAVIDDKALVAAHLEGFVLANDRVGLGLSGGDPKANAHAEGVGGLLVDRPEDGQLSEVVRLKLQDLLSGKQHVVFLRFDHRRLDALGELVHFLRDPGLFKHHAVFVLRGQVVFVVQVNFHRHNHDLADGHVLEFDLSQQVIEFVFDVVFVGD